MTDWFYINTKLLTTIIQELEANIKRIFLHFIKIYNYFPGVRGTLNEIGVFIFKALIYMPYLFRMPQTKARPL